MSDQPIAIRVSPYEMWIYNRSIFPSGWTEETLFSMHESKLLNPNIAVGFFRAGLVERFGSGIQKIVDFCKENGNPKPRYNIQSDMLTLKIESRPANIELALGHRQGLVDGRVGANDIIKNVTKDVTKDVTNNVTRNKQADKINPRLNEVMLLLKQNVSLEDVANSLGVAKRTIIRDTSWLKDHGYLRHEGSVRNGKWIIVKELGEDE